MTDVKAHKTTIELVIYSQEPIGDEMASSLEGLAWSISEGDHIGDWKVVKTEEVEGDELRMQLVDIGNDGRFFDSFDDEDDEDYTEVAPGVSVPSRNVVAADGDDDDAGQDDGLETHPGINA